MYKFLLFLLIIPINLLLNTYKIHGIDESFQIINGEKLILEKCLLKDIKINKKTILMDLTADIEIYKNAKDATDDATDDTTDDILKTGKFIYKKEDIEKYIEYYNYFYDFLKKDLENGFKENGINIEISFNNNNSIDQTSDEAILYIEIQEYYEGQYNLIKNEKTKFKISVKLYRKYLINNNIVLFIKNYKCKSNIINVNEKLRIKNISNLCSYDIIRILKRKFLIR